MRNVKDYIKGLRDGRNVYIDSDWGPDVTAHRPSAALPVGWPGCVMSHPPLHRDTMAFF